jgi:hypothetical protein
MLGDPVSPALGASVAANIRPGMPGNDIGVPTGLRIMFASRWAESGGGFGSKLATASEEAVHM